MTRFAWNREHRNAENRSSWKERKMEPPARPARWGMACCRPCGTARRRNPASAPWAPGPAAARSRPSRAHLSPPIAPAPAWTWLRSSSRRACWVVRSGNRRSRISFRCPDDCCRPKTGEGSEEDPGNRYGRMPGSPCQGICASLPILPLSASPMISRLSNQEDFPLKKQEY